MKKLAFSVDIFATKAKVWEVLWGDDSLREWADLIDPGTYMVGKLVEGSEIKFISAEGYGVTSFVEEVTPYDFVLFRHKADTQAGGTESRDDQWTGGVETYTLSHKEGVTKLVIAFDAPEELVEIMADSYPKALGRIKRLAEA